MNDKEFAIDACSCPRAVGEPLFAPLCTVEFFAGNGDDGVGRRGDGTLLVKSPPNLTCSSATTFGYGNICKCKSRALLYQKYNI